MIRRRIEVASSTRIPRLQTTCGRVPDAERGMLRGEERAFVRAPHRRPDVHTRDTYMHTRAKALQIGSSKCADITSRLLSCVRYSTRYELEVLSWVGFSHNNTRQRVLSKCKYRHLLIFQVPGSQALATDQ